MTDTGKAWALVLSEITAKRYRSAPAFESCPGCQWPMNFDPARMEHYCEKCGSTASPLFFEARRLTA
jgi:hypothetical protein